MANAHPCLLLNLVREKAPDTRFFALGRYCSNHTSWRKAVAEYLEASEDAAKVELMKIFYG